MTASTITWSGGDPGQLWADPLDWIGHAAPGAGDTAVLIGTSAEFSATIAEDSTAAIQNATLEGFYLAIHGTLALGGTLTLGAGSSLSGGTVGGGTLDLIDTGLSSTLDGVTVIGTPPATYLYLFDPAAIVGGFTSFMPDMQFYTTVLIGSQTLKVVELDTTEVSLTGTVTLAAGGTLDNLVDYGGLTIDGAGGTGTLVNDGTIADTNSLSLLAALTNNGQIVLSGTYDDLQGALANTGTIVFGGGDTFFTATPGTSFSNSGLLNVAGGTLDVEQIPFADTGGTISLGGSAELSLGATLQGGAIIGTGGTIGGGTNANGTLDGVSLEGTLTLGDFTLEGLTASGDTQFASESPGVRASATLVTPLTFTGDATLNDVDLTLVSFVPSGQLKGSGALTLGADSGVAFAGTATISTSFAPEIVAATSLTLGGRIGGFDGLFTLGAGSGGIVNTGTIATVAGETLAVTTTGSFQNRGVLSLAAGSTLDLTANVVASAFSGIAATAAFIVLNGTLSGDGTPGGSTATLPAGTTFSTGGTGELSNVTIDAQGSIGPLFGSLNNVAWAGVPLLIENTGFTYLTGGLTVEDAAHGPGTLEVGGTNSILSILDSETLDNLTLDIGATSASPASDTYTVLQATSADLTFGSGAIVNLGGNAAVIALQVDGTLTNYGHIDLGGDTGLTANAANGAVTADGPNPNGSAYPMQLAVAFIRNFGDLKDPSGSQAVYDRQAASKSPTPPDPYWLMIFKAVGAALTGHAPTVNGGSLSFVTAATAASAPGISAYALATAATTVEGTGSIEIDAGASLGIDGTVEAGQQISFGGTYGVLALGTPTQVQATISGFGALDAIDLSIDGYIGGAATETNGQLVLPTASGNIALNVEFAAGYSAADVQLADDTQGGTFAYIACFAEGTRIATARGAVAVEALRLGDRACVAGGGTRPIVWIGHRNIDCTRHPDPRKVWPVRVRAGAFGPGRPAADVRLSPDHAVFADGILVPVRHLIDGRAIVQEPVTAITYWHVELDRHDVILAEGLPCESFLDTGNRSAFVNGPVVQMHPDFSRRLWDADGCAPLVVAGPVLERVRAQVFAYGSEATESADRTRNRSANSERATGSSSGSVKPGWAAAGTTNT